MLFHDSMKAAFSISILILFTSVGFGADLVVAGKDVLTQKEVKVDPRTSKKGAVVIFISARCPCSSSHEKIIGEMVKEFPDFSFVAVHSNMDEPLNLTKSHFSESKLPLPIVQDDHAQLANRFKALKTPHTYVISKDGEVLYSGGITNSHNGPKASRNYLREVLTSINKNEKPPISQEKSLGCLISRRE